MNGGVKQLLVMASFAAAGCAAAPDQVEVRPIGGPGTKLRAADDPLAAAKGQFAIGNVGLAEGIDLQLRHGRARFFDDVFFPRLELAQEVSAVAAAHEFLVFPRAIALDKDDPVERFEVFAAIKVD